jgi:hypothetical protein
MDPEKRWAARRDYAAYRLHTNDYLSIECRDAPTGWKAPLIMYYLLVGVVCLFVAWRVMSYPFAGLLLMLAVNPLEGMIPLPFGLSAGRLVSFVTVLGWLAYLRQNAQALRRLRGSKVLRGAWPFLVICFLGVVLNGESDVRSYSYAINLVLLAVMALMVEHLVDRQERLHQLTLVVALSSVVAAAFPIAYHFGFDLYTPFGVEASEAVAAGRAAGLAGNANAVGLACSMGLFALLILIMVQNRVWPVLGLSVLGLVMVGGLLLSGSRTHVVAAIVCTFSVGGLGFIGPKRSRLVTGLAAGVVVVLLVAAYLQVPGNVQKRLVLAGNQVDESTLRRESFSAVQRSHALALLWDHPLVGIGLKNFHFPAGLDTHDTISTLVGETGLLGVLSFLWLVVPCWKSLYRGARVGRRLGALRLYLYSAGFMASFAAMFVAGLGGYIVIYQRWFWITLAAAVVVGRWAQVTSYDYNGRVTGPVVAGVPRKWASRRPLRAAASRTHTM